MLLAAGANVAGERKSIPFQIRCSAAWLERVQAAADAKELSIAAFIRLAVTERMNADGVKVVRPEVRKPKKPS